MKAVLTLIVMTGAVDIEPPMSPEVAKDRWHYVTHMCWEGTTLEGDPISETEMKVACITAGVLTQFLIEANYCLHPTEAEWKPC